MAERLAHSDYKLPPGQWQKEKSVHPFSLLQMSACALVTIFKRDQRDPIIVRLELADVFVAF
jgi:hypothetical protein